MSKYLYDLSGGVPKHAKRTVTTAGFSDATGTIFQAVAGKRIVIMYVFAYFASDNPATDINFTLYGKTNGRTIVPYSLIVRTQPPVLVKLGLKQKTVLDVAEGVTWKTKTQANPQSLTVEIGYYEV